MLQTENIEKALKQRNSFWKDCSSIPSWINLDNVGLDQFFTKQNIAELCYKKAIKFLKFKHVKIEDCIFIEPSAGSGSFYNLLPKKNRIGIDICPMNSKIVQADFLTWVMPKTSKTIVVIGNPPFGYRAWLALEFMKKAATFADYVFFILPMSFQSEGKGSPKNRISGLKLINSELLPSNSFYSPDGKDYKINALFQIWEKGNNEPFVEDKFLDYMDIFTTDNRKERLCGQNKKAMADFFLQRTFFNTPPNIVKTFDEVKYQCGYGFIIKKDKEKIKNILNKTNWYNYSNLAVHGCHHISMYHIRKVLSENGLRQQD